MAPPFSSFFRPIFALLCLAAAGACGDSIGAWGTNVTDARRGADQAANGFSIRFTNVKRDAKFEAARPRMGRYALAPSGLYRDSSVWTIHNAPDSSQALYLAASLESDGYRFRARPQAPYPAALGGQRHYIRLRKLTSNQYEWITIVDHAIGSAPAAAIGAGIERFLTSFEGRDTHRVRSDLQSLMPQTSRQMGRLFHIDSLASTPAADGSTSLQLNVSWRPDSLRRHFPAFAAYVEKYIMPADFEFVLRDASGARYLHVVGTPGRMRLAVRARQGHWVALTGAPRPMPDTLILHTDASMKFRIFRVGFRNLEGTVIRERTSRDRTIVMRWQKEPDWRFPLAVNQLIKTPLRAPFAGRGVEMRLGVRDDLGSQTMSLRHLRLVVHESAIMRWLGGLGATAFGDFEGQSEAEENRFLMEAFEAMRRDISR